MVSGMESCSLPSLLEGSNLLYQNLLHEGTSTSLPQVRYEDLHHHLTPLTTSLRDFQATLIMMLALTQCSNMVS